MHAPKGRQLGDEKNRSPTFLRGIAFSLLFLLFVLTLSCLHEGASSGRKLDSNNVAQIRSLSLLGPEHASVILGKTRELRLTADGGRSWQLVPPTAIGGAFECATMIDTARGVAVNHQGHVFKTDSGGATWTKISEIEDFTGAHQLEFVNDQEGWMREFLSIWRTRDGGLTWRKTLSTGTPGVYGQPTGMFIKDIDNVACSGSDGQTYLSKDGGESWKIETSISGNSTFADVWFVDKMRGWLTGYMVVVAGERLRPLLFETTDGGDSWKEISVEADILPTSVCFVGNQGWLAGHRRIANGSSINLVGVLLYSEDGGIHWTSIQFRNDEPSFTTVRFTDKTNGWLLGRDTLYRTEDGGKTWKSTLHMPLPTMP